MSYKIDAQCCVALCWGKPGCVFKKNQFIFFYNMITSEVGLCAMRMLFFNDNMPIRCG